MTMNLRPRFLLITVLFFVVIAAPMWLALRFSSEQIVGKWALRFAEKQVLYDKSRTLQPILREVALSRQLADSSIIRQWARNPDNPEMTQLAILENAEAHLIKRAGRQLSFAANRMMQYMASGMDSLH